MDSRDSPSYLEVSIKASKKDVFRKGVTVVLGRMGADVCPVAAILSYMALLKPGAASHPTPFFSFSDGSPLTKERWVRELREALSSAGVKADHYAGHSFRIGAATMAATQGMLDSLIKTLGRWESAAYTLYIRTPRSTLPGGLYIVTVTGVYGLIEVHFLSSAVQGRLPHHPLGQVGGSSHLFPPLYTHLHLLAGVRGGGLRIPYSPGSSTMSCDF